MKNIIVTGSGGILGTALLQELINDLDCQIFAVTSQVERLTAEHKDNKNIQVLPAVEAVPPALEYIVINCAFPRSNKGKDLAEAFDYTENLIKELSDKKVLRFINISSQNVYAQSGDEIQTEESQVEPMNLYGMTKYAVEYIVKLSCEHYDMPYTNIRLGSLASESFDQRMINRFYTMIKNKETITVDQGKPKVSYLHVEDAAAALTKLISRIFSHEEVSSLYNLANNDWIYIPDLIAKCLEYGEELGLGRSQVVYSDNLSDYNNVVNSDLFYQ